MNLTVYNLGVWDLGPPLALDISRGGPPLLTATITSAGLQSPLDRTATITLANRMPGCS